MKLSRRKIAGSAALVLALAATLTLTATNAFGRASADRTHTIAASHSFTGASGLSALRYQSSVPSDVAHAVQQLAAFDHTDPAAALSRVRLARAGTSAASTVYTFADDRGNECVVAAALTLFCNPDSGTPVAGINWSIGGGDPQNPDSLIAIYSNQVAGISLNVDGATVPVTSANNIAYAEFPASSKDATITVTYADGSSNTIPTDLTAPAGS